MATKTQGHKAKLFAKINFFVWVAKMFLHKMQKIHN